MSSQGSRSKFAGLPPELRDSLLEEERQNKQAAEAFARVCRDGDADNQYDAHLWLNECVDAWRPPMAKVAKLQSVSAEIQAAFLPIWVESKMLPLRVGHRPTMAAALRVLLPGGRLEHPLTLYRGTNIHERRRRIYGFSWTTDIATARSFAEHWSQARLTNDGVILQTLAPPEVVLLIRQPEKYYDEGEVVVDPFRLDKVAIVEHLTARKLEEAK